MLQKRLISNSTAGKAGGGESAEIGKVTLGESGEQGKERPTAFNCMMYRYHPHLHVMSPEKNKFAPLTCVKKCFQSTETFT